MILTTDIESLITEVQAIPPNHNFSREISFLIADSPNIILELLPYFFKKNLTAPKSEALLELILCCFDQIRYALDRKSPAAKVLFDDTQELLHDLYRAQPENIDKISKINAMIYESKLNFIIDSIEKSPTSSDTEYHITNAQFIELLEQIRISHHIRSSFDFYDALMSQIQVMPIQHHLEIIRRLMITKKTVPHEVAVMMLLHPVLENRQAVSTLFLAFADRKVFTPLDLRRLIAIRDWLPIAEQGNIDILIEKIRGQGVRPYPYAISKIDKIVASEFDGAGAQMIMFKLKHQNHHVVAGFVLKQGIGIREPWVEIKAHKEQFNVIRQQSELFLKPVSLAYVNRAVSHFLAEGHDAGNVPSPLLLELAELVGASEWKARRVIIQEEINRLNQKMDFNLKDKNEVRRALARTEDWYFTESFMRTWFECGELAEMAVQKAAAWHEKLSKAGQTPSMQKVLIEKLVVPNIEKWKVLMLFMCFWAKSKEVEEPLWQDMLIFLDQIVSGDTQLEDIPVIQHIASQTIAVLANFRDI